MTPLEAANRLMFQREEVRFFPDEWLNKSLLHFLRPYDTSRVHAEILLRWWLYQGECPQCILDATSLVENDLRAFVESGLLPLRANRARRAENLAFQDRHNGDTPPSAAERILKALVLNYAEADGIFPVVRWGSAVPIPFKIKPPLNNQGSVCAGSTQFSIWTAEAHGLWEAEGNFQIDIQAEFDPLMANCMVGGSFALSALLAKTFQGEVCRFKWMATGCIHEGKIGPVEGIEPKAELARKLGVRLWISPGEDFAGAAAEGSLRLPVGLDSRAAVDEVAVAFAKSCIRAPSPANALAMLERIQPRGSIARKPLSRAIERVKDALNVLDHNPRFVGPNIVQGRLLLAELLNHHGKERDADPILRGLLNEFPADWRLLADAGPKLVVSLCYQGDLCAAAVEGEKLFQRLDTFPETLPGLEARVKVAGCYGGDALLHLALRTGSRALAEKSRAGLEMNLEFARQLAALAGDINGAEISPRFSLGMSISRMAVWHALFEPERIQEQVGMSLEALPELDANVGYLRRTRFLGLYRLLLNEKRTPDSATFSSWEMRSRKRTPLHPRDCVQIPGGASRTRR